ncbi:MAG: agmatinase, partial [Bacillota bacterium]
MSEESEPDHSRRGPVPAFAGIRTFMKLPHVDDPSELEGCDFAIIGVPSDTGATYRTGARFAPSAIREMSSVLRGYNPALGVAPTDLLRGVDFGDTPVLPTDAAGSMQLIEDVVGSAVDAGVVPICLGGDHSISLPVLRALAGKYGPLALIHFDSHSDTWDEVYGGRFNHATPFRRAVEENLILPQSSIQLGIRGPVPGARDLDNARQLGFTLIEAENLLNMDPEEVSRTIRDVVRDEPVYLSFDIDFLDPAHAPGTGTPEVGGPSSAQALSYIRRLDLSSVRGVDLVEVLPACDPSQITSLTA